MTEKHRDEQGRPVGKDRFAERAREIVRAKAARKGRPLTVHVHTFGCQQNESDSERILWIAETLGYEKTDSVNGADLIIYNTCAVREHAELRALSKVGQLKHQKAQNPELLIGLWGCMVTQEHRKDEIKNKYPYVDFVAGTNMLHRFPEILCDVLESKRRRFYIDGAPHKIAEGISSCRASDIKAWLPVMYGCDNFCTYCVVPHVRGRERSRLPGSVLAEAEEIVRKGYKEITLLGQNVNSYGKTLPVDESIDFAGLLRRVCEIKGDFWVRFMTSHPKDVSDELLCVIARSGKAAKHFHLPMQAGANPVLRRMNRRYTREQFLDLALRIKATIPGITLTTDVICGFPGETERDFDDTLDMLPKIEFDSIFSFLYSPRKGTPAAAFEGQLAHCVKTERFSRMLALQQQISEKINGAYVGKTLRVLTESERDLNTGYYSGRSGGNKVIRFLSKRDDLYGRFTDVTVTRAEKSGLFGEEKT